MKRSILFGMRTSACIRAPVAAVAEVERQSQAEIGDEGEGMGRIDRERRQDRENVLEEMIVEPEPFGLFEGRRVDEDDMLGLQQLLQLAPAGRPGPRPARRRGR